VLSSLGGPGGTGRVGSGRTRGWTSEEADPSSCAGVDLGDVNGTRGDSEEDCRSWGSATLGRVGRAAAAAATNEGAGSGGDHAGGGVLGRS